MKTIKTKHYELLQFCYRVTEKMDGYDKIYALLYFHDIDSRYLSYMPLKLLVSHEHDDIYSIESSHNLLSFKCEVVDVLLKAMNKFKTNLHKKTDIYCKNLDAIRNVIDFKRLNSAYTLEDNENILKEYILKQFETTI